MTTVGVVRVKTIAFAILGSVMVLTLSGCGGVPGATHSRPDNIILFIGDGMGNEQLRAASLFATGEHAGLQIQGFPVSTQVTTHSASSDITDSAAAATAMATGHKVENGVVGVRLPGDGSDLPTILEMMKAAGKAVGLVTTTHLTHATPAGFAAHVSNRSDVDGIAWDYLNETQPDVLFGGGGSGLTVDDSVAAGYSVVTMGHELDGILVRPAAALIGDGHLSYVFDGRDTDEPTLLEMTEAAVDVLSQDPDGYFLVVEAGRIDHAAHNNDLERMIPEVLELDAVVGSIVTDASAMSGTVVVVTADHETGGLSVVSTNGVGILPEVTWSTDYHTGVAVPLFAVGIGAATFAEADDNTDIFTVMQTLL